MIGNLLSTFYTKTLEYFGFIEPTPINSIDLQIEEAKVRVIERTGTITALCYDFGIIDGWIGFSVTLPLCYLDIGDTVSYKYDPNVGVASDIKLEKKINGPNDLYKSAIGKITRRNGRIFVVTPGKHNFNLDDVHIEFLPYIGDWVELIFNDQTGRNRVETVLPLRTKMFTGSITNFVNDVGIINNHVYFTLYNCTPGYRPSLNDRVICSIIESDQGVCDWRAIIITKINQVNLYRQLKEMEALHRINPVGTDRNENIIITYSDFILLYKDEKKIFKASVKSNSNNQELFRIEFDSQGVPVTLIRPNCTDKIGLNLNSVIDFEFEAKGCDIGCSLITIIWHFKGFTLSSTSRVEVILNSNMEWNTDTAHNLMTRVVNKKGCRNILSKKNRIVMPGARHFRPLSFIPVNLGKYEMPNDILTTVSKNDNKNFLDQMIELQKILPYLKQDLCEENYKARFHTLLFLEEIMHLNKISRLQMESSFRAVNGLFIITLPDNEDINLLGVGDRVYADTAWKDLTEDIMYEGFIEQISGNDIYVNFHREFEKQEAEGRFYRIQFETSRSVFRRKHQAVDVCAKHLGYDWLFPTRMTIRKAQIKIIDEKEDCGSNDNRCTVSKTELKKRIAWNHLGHGLGSKAKIWNNDKPYVDVCLTAKINWFNTKLNKEQKTCIKNILEGIARPLPYIIFGPPGTGKTFTLTELIFQISMLIPGSRLLIAAASNSAIDILACNLMNTGLKKSDMVRLLSHKYANQGRLPVKLMSVSAIPVFDFKLSEDSTNAYGVRTISRDLIGRQKVTMGTLSLLGILYNMGFPSGHFTHIIIDEAGQATEPEMLIPVGFLNKHFGQLILAGDPMQLGPVVLSELALRFGLKESYLNRIISRFPFTQDPYQFEGSSGFDPRLITKLRHNYRALPSIVSLYSELFYNNELISEVCVPESWEYNKLMNVADIFTTSNKQLYPVLFHGIDGLEAIEPGSTSYYNKFEVMQVIIYLKRMYALKVKPEEVGVVTPYTSQVKKINQLCNEFGIEGPKVGTVEEFQGQERDFIIISTVRTSTHLNPSHFICNPRRFNVSISRCKSGLIIIGNPAAIGRIKEWNYILKLCLRQKSYKGVPFPTGTL